MHNTSLQKRTLAILRIVVIAIALALVTGISAQEKHPFAGNWKANLEKSQRHENHQFKSATMLFEIKDDEVAVTFSGINMAGKQEGGTRKMHPDGREHPVTEAPGFVEISKWVGKNRLETVVKKDSVINGQSSYEVSSDGKTLTATLKGIDGKGRPFEQVIVFDRE